MKKINELDFLNKNVFIRCDFNCPVNKSYEITDDFRIRSSLKSLNEIINLKPNKLIIATHFGRPKNKDYNFSTKLFITRLKKYLKQDIFFLPNGLDSIEKDIQKSGIYLMENVRFHDYETNINLKKNINLSFDIYCNEAFSCSHRNHTSINNIPHKEKCYGYCFLKELEHLDIILNPSESDRKLAIIGGGKMDDKIPMLKNLSKKVDFIFITGGNVNSFVDNFSLIKEIEGNKAKIILPIDGFGALKPEDDPEYFKLVFDKGDKFIFDMGPLSMNLLFTVISDCETVFWNGSLGITEHVFYKNSSEMLIKYLKNSLCEVIIGGGDTAGFVNKYENNFDHISTGGGASIEYISNGTLIGIS